MAIIVPDLKFIFLVPNQKSNFFNPLIHEITYFGPKSKRKKFVGTNDVCLFCQFWKYDL